MAVEYGDDRFMLLLSLDAFERAYRRWEAVHVGLNEAESFGALTECLWWADSIDERFAELEGKGYRRRRDADDDGRILLGIHWARNRTGHDQALVLRYHPGAEVGRLTVGVSRLGTLSELLWRSVDELPRGRSTVGREEYSRWLDGNPVRDAVTAARRWFQGAARSTGPLAFGP